MFVLILLKRDHHGADNDHDQHPLEGDAAQNPLRQGHRHVPDGLLRHGLPGPAGVRLRQLHLLREGPSDAKEAGGEGGEGQQREGGQVRRGEGELLPGPVDERIEDRIKKYMLINKCPFFLLDLDSRSSKRKWMH